MILEQQHAARLNQGDPCDTAPDVALEIRASVAEQGLHGLAAVVAGDVGVEVLPDALDAVGVGAVGRQEVEGDAVTEGLEGASGRLRRVDGVVVDDEVDSPHARIVAGRSQNSAADLCAMPVVCRTPVRTSSAPAR